MATRIIALARFAVVGALLLPASAEANVGSPHYGGQIVAEPTGLKDVAITRETLTIDLRPLAVKELAHVEAIYHLDNRGPERLLELLFVSGSRRMADFKVWLGDQPVPSAPASQAEVPKSWQPPKQTPGIHDARGLGYYPDRPGGERIAFSITLPPGPQTLKVRYQAEAAFYHRSDQATVYRQFAYVLAPAKDWGSFGGLDVAIHLPEGWQAAFTPEMAREGDVLRGSFADLPADAIALTVQAPIGVLYQPLVYGSQILLALVVLAGAIVCWRGGTSKRIRQHSPWLRGFVLPVAWGLAIFAVGYFAIEGPSLAIPAFQENNYGYGKAFAMVGVILLSLIAAPVGYTLCLIAALIARPRMDRAAGSSDVPQR